MTYRQVNLATSLVFVTSDATTIEVMRFSTFQNRFLAIFLVLLLVFSHAGDAEAKKSKRRGKKQQTISRPSGVNDARYAAIIMNPVTGEV